jgi:hypothetical protein
VIETSVHILEEDITDKPLSCAKDLLAHDVARASTSTQGFANVIFGADIIRSSTKGELNNIFRVARDCEGFAVLRRSRNQRMKLCSIVLRHQNERCPGINNRCAASQASRFAIDSSI